MRFFVIKLKNVIFAALAVCAVFAAVKCGKSVVAFVTGGREIPIYSVEREDNKIALTFDCAWNDSDIDDIIKTLKEYGVTATFFVTGRWAEEYEDSMRKLVRGGFEIGIHSYNHDDYTKMSEEEIERDIAKCDKAVMRATGIKPYALRVPSGAYNNTAVRTVERNGRACVQWSVDALDYTQTTADEIYERAVGGTKEGDIILLHNGTELTAEVLPEIIRTLKGKFELVNISDLIYTDNFTVDHSGRQHMKTEPTV